MVKKEACSHGIPSCPTVMPFFFFFFTLGGGGSESLFLDSRFRNSFPNMSDGEDSITSLPFGVCLWKGKQEFVCMFLNFRPESACLRIYNHGQA